METYSDNNSAPPELPEQSAGSSVSSRLQDEYEELLKYAVVVPKIDVDDLPRVLADSKRAITQHRDPSPQEIIHTSESESDGEEVAWNLKSTGETPVRQRQGLGRIITPVRKQPNKESDIQIVTPRTKVSPSHMPRERWAPRVTNSDEALPHSDRAADRVMASESETESEMFFDKTVTSEREVAPSESDLAQIERKIELWSRQFNSNIMDEISNLRVKLLESARHQLQSASSKHLGELNAVRNEMEGLRELLNTYEVSIERKDAVIANLTRSLQNQKDKFETLKTFTEWKIQFAAKKQEGYGMRLAAQHHHLALKRRCWKTWHMIIVEKWRRRVERACQAKAQEVCVSLTNDYETKLKSLDEKYLASRDEVMVLHREREHYEENMKKAFMRGVCALNMEAMNMFHEPEPSEAQGGVNTVQHESTGTNQQPSQYDRENQPPHSTEYLTPSSSGMITAINRPYTVAHEPAYVTGSQTRHASYRPDISKGKRLTATVTATSSTASREGCGAGSVSSGKPGKPSTARLMSGRSILVERHDANSVSDDIRSPSASESSQVGRSVAGVKVTSTSDRTSLPKKALSSRVVKIVS